MGMPMYVSPEQMMKDKADFARKGIARGRAAVGCTYADGVRSTTGSGSSAWAATTSSTASARAGCATPT